MCDVLAVHTASESEFVVEGEVKVDVVIISYFICFYHDLPPFILDRAHNLGTHMMKLPISLRAFDGAACLHSFDMLNG